MMRELLPDRKKPSKCCRDTNQVLQKKECKHKCETNNVTTHKAKMLHELLPDMKKAIKTLWAHKLTTKAQRLQMKAQNQQSTAHNSKSDT